MLAFTNAFIHRNMNVTHTFTAAGMRSSDELAKVKGSIWPYHCRSSDQLRVCVLMAL